MEYKKEAKKYRIKVKFAGSVPKQHQWDDLRMVASLIKRLTPMNSDDKWLKRWSVTRLENIADVLEDMYEHSRDH